jgi:YggT family protein
MLLALFGVVDLLLDVLRWIIIIQAILSWLVAFNVINTQSNFMRSFLTRSTGSPSRSTGRSGAYLPDFGGIDFSPLVRLLIIIALQLLLGGLATDLARSGMA